MTVEVGAASAELVDVAVPSGLLPSPGTRVEVDESAVLSNEFWVMVDVDDEREEAEDVPRCDSLSSVAHEQTDGG